MKERYNKYYLVVIADYNDDDAHGIVHDNLYYWFDQHDLTILEFDRVDVKPFNTVQTGYILARRALNPLSRRRAKSSWSTRRRAWTIRENGIPMKEKGSSRRG